jgi:hypothetical protein
VNFGEKLWYVALLLMTVLTVLFGYFFHPALAGMFWVLAVLILLVLRPL